MRAGAVVVMVLAVLLGGCGGTPKSTTDVSFFTTQTVTPTSPVQGQNYLIGFALENDDEQKSTLTNVQWSVSRNGVPNVYSGTIPSLVSHQPVPITLTDAQAAGTYIYTITIDPNNQIREISKTNNSVTISVTVLPLSIQ